MPTHEISEPPDKKALLAVIDKRISLTEKLKIIPGMLGIIGFIDTNTLICSVITYLKQTRDSYAYRVNCLLSDLSNNKKLLEFSTKKQVIEFIELIDADLVDIQPFLGELLITGKFTMDEMLALEKTKPLLYGGAISYVFLKRWSSADVTCRANI